MKTITNALAGLLGWLPALLMLPAPAEAQRFEPLGFECPSNRVVWSCGTAPVAVTFAAPKVTGDCASNAVVTFTPPSGSLFPVGVSTVLCAVTNRCRERINCTFTVTVMRDTTDPSIICPSNIVVMRCGINPVAVSFPTPLASDAQSGRVTVVCTPPSGSLFPLGSTMVTCEAVDACANRSRCTFTVTVTIADTNAPSLTCPNGVVVWTCETNGVVVNYPAPTVMDDMDRSPTVECSPPSGSLFPVGVTMVTCTAEDDCGNRTNCVFTVTVNRDTTPPQLECLDQITAFTCDPAGKTAAYPFVEVSDNHDPNPTLICIPPAGSLLPPGTNVILCIAIDSCSNRTECAFNYIVILDNVPPVITCPPDIRVTSCDPGGVRVEFPDPQFGDNNVFQPTASCVPHSGSIFPIGVTKVICTATDHCGNRSQCMFTVTVTSDISLTNAPGIDTDGNGLSDIWEIHFNTGALEPNADSDGDGMSNAAEAGAGTDPLNPGSNLRIDSIEPIADGGSATFNEFTISKKTDSASTKRFQLQFTAALAEPWADLGLPKRGNGTSVEFRIPLDDTNLPPTIATQAFLRLAVSDVDEDGDGVTAWEESILGTSDLSPNTHGGRGGDHGGAQQHAAENIGTASRLREVALAHVGGTPQGPTQTKLVTSVGTGGAIQLSSWTVDLNTDDPVHLLDAPPVVGFNTKLHVLTPPTSPSLSLNLFVHGRIGSEGNLWLTVYKLGANGAFSELSTLGYGANASVRVLDFAMAHRPLFLSGIVLETFQFLTPIICTNTAGQLDLRVLSWTVHPNTGKIIATYDSGGLGHTDVPRDGGSLQCAHLRDGFFTFNYSTAKNVLSSWFAEANAIGVVFQRGGAASGLDNLGKKPVAESATTFGLGGLNPRGFVTALLGTNCNLSMITWEERVVACDAGCSSLAFRVTDNSLDQTPAANGVLLAPPKVTNSREDGSGKSSRFGHALAIADFDGDGFADVAVGVPGQSDSSGQVDVMYGSASGLTGSGQDQRWTQDSSGLTSSPEYPDQFGWSLAAGDFNGDGFADLAIGAPFESVGNNAIENAGAVQVLYGSANGLTAVGNQVLIQGNGGLAGTAEDGDTFGRALAAGDFNGDGRDDLAVGVPLENVNGVVNAGAVQIIYGSAGGLAANAGPGNHILFQGLGALKGDLETDDWFGQELAAGDFNGDGRADLAVGVPFDSVGGVENAGAVQVLYGSPGGLGATDHFITQSGFLPGGEDIIGAMEEYDEFGRALAVGDFNDDGRDDLAIGVPSESDEAIDVELNGAVHILYGSAAGLSAAGNQFITQSGIQPGGANIIGLPEYSDFFGGSLAAGDFDGDGRVDLAIGAPIEGLATGPVEGAGAVHILYGTFNGLAAGGNQLFHQDTDSIGETAEEGDHFGSVLAAGDLNGDGTADLVVGVPGERLDDDKADPAVDAGVIQSIYGTSSGLTASGDQVWKQGRERKVRALLTDKRREDAGGIGAGEMFLKMPAGELLTNHVASVTKVMTLLLAVEELTQPGSTFSLNDDVTVSALAAHTGGSRMGLSTGYPPLGTNDVMPLGLLMYGMMLESCNKSSVAIAQHFTGETEAYGVWTNLMNQKAAALGMVNTLYTQPAGGCITTPQDQVTLWRHGWQFPLFRQLVSQKLYFDCGVDEVGLPKCYPVEKFGDSGYPGLDGWKGGNGGLGPKLGVPWCTEAGVRQATRLDRPLIVALSQTANKETDGDALFEYGYKLLFTPDYRGGALLNVPGLTIADFAVRTVTDTLAVTAVIDKQNHLRLNTWQVVAGIRQIASLGAATLSINNLAAGNRVIPTTLVDMTLSPTVESEQDYLTGHLENGNLRLDIWRVAAKPEF